MSFRIAFPISVKIDVVLIGITSLSKVLGT